MDHNYEKANGAAEFKNTTRKGSKFLGILLPMPSTIHLPWGLSPESQSLSQGSKCLRARRVGSCLTLPRVTERQEMLSICQGRGGDDGDDDGLDD